MGFDTDLPWAALHVTLINLGSVLFAEAVSRHLPASFDAPTSSPGGGGPRPPCSSTDWRRRGVNLGTAPPNTWHHLLHLATSTLLLVAGLRRSWAPVGALIFGAIYVVLAPAGWIDGDDAFNIVYGSTRENLVHTALAAQGVGLGWLALQGPCPR